MVRLGTTYRVPVQPDQYAHAAGVHHQQLSRERQCEIDIWIENEEAERLVTGTATVEFFKVRIAYRFGAAWDSTTGPAALTGLSLMLRKSGVATSAPVHVSCKREDGKTPAFPVQMWALAREPGWSASLTTFFGFSCSAI